MGLHTRCLCQHRFCLPRQAQGWLVDQTKAKDLGAFWVLNICRIAAQVKRLGASPTGRVQRVGSSGGQLRLGCAGRLPKKEPWHSHLQKLAFRTPMPNVVKIQYAFSSVTQCRWSHSGQDGPPGALISCSTSCLPSSWLSSCQEPRHGCPPCSTTSGPERRHQWVSQGH